MKALMWKVDRRIVPFVAMLYLCSYLDRVNIGNAKIAGLMEDIDITEKEYGLALSIFFVSYVIFEVPSNLVLKWLGPRLWISIIMVVWGIIMAAVSGVIFYLSVWYTRKEIAFRIALFYGSASLAGAFGGILAWAISHMEGLQNLNGWQWIFIIEAIPTVVFGILTYFVLPDFPESTKFLNEREREIILMRNKRDAGITSDVHFSWSQVRSTFLDWKVYVYASIFLTSCIPVYGLSMFMPSIVKGMGYESVTAQAMSSPPYVLAFIWCLVNSYDADRRGERGFHMMVSGTFSVIGYILIIALSSVSDVGKYIGVVIATIGAFGLVAAMMSWFSNNFSGHTRRGVAIALITTIGNTSGAISGQVYQASDEPLYIKGHSISLALIATCVIITGFMKFMLTRINKKRDNMTPEEYRIASEGTELGENHPGFRFIT
ncbi:major facilitator superfamily domain-containing protein [Circinella umbellata]|nr:major facilitator superfamily domain-containing protein [Circinella umbellata]